MKPHQDGAGTAAAARPARAGADGALSSKPNNKPWTRRAFVGAAFKAMGALWGAGALPALWAGGRQTQARPALRVGASLSLTGDFALEGRNVRLAYAYWADEVNAAGGLLGRPAELAILDDGGSPARCAANYRRLISEGADLLLGPYGSSVTFEAIPVFEAAGRPCAIPISASPQLWAEPRRWSVQVTPNADRYMDGPLEEAAARGARTVALVHLDSGFTNDIAAGVRRKAAELRLELVADEAYPHEQIDFEALLAPIAAEDPDILIGGGYIHSAVGLTRSARRLRFSPRLMCFMEGPHRWPWPRWMGAEGDYVASSGLWLPSAATAGNAAFTAGFRARHAHEHSMDLMGALSHVTAAGYAAALITQRAAEAAGTLEPAPLRDALFALRTQTPYGAYAVDAGGRQAGKRVLATQWVGGRQIIFWPPELADGRFVYPAPPWDERV